MQLSFFGCLVLSIREIDVEPSCIVIIGGLGIDGKVGSYFSCLEHELDL
jgi:hypothetical protein